MQCHEIQEQLRSFIDGNVDARTRKQVGLHLVDCDDCMRLVNDDRFWDDAVMSLFEREAPADLRSEILGDLADDHPRSRLTDLSGVGWKKKLKFYGWAATRNSNPKDMIRIIAWVAVVIVVVQLIIRYLD